VDNTHQKKREHLKTSFIKFVPVDFVDYVVELFIQTPVKFKIVPPRKTKLGDFRMGTHLEKPEITVNGDLNPYSFLVTTIHEFAHLHTFLTYGHRVAPHGSEWKNCYKKLLLPILDSKKLPEDIEKVLINSLISVKASSCSDQHLSRTLKKYDPPKQGIELLEKLPKNSIFVLNGREFKKGELRRKKFLCEEMISHRMYLVNALAEVIPIKELNGK
jgi:SprT protein